MFTRKKSIWIMQKFQTIHVTSIQSTKGASVDDVCTIVYYQNYLQVEKSLQSDQFYYAACCVKMHSK